MSKTMILALSVSAVALAACADPAKDKAKATVGEAKPLAAAVSGEAATYAIRPAESKVAFTGAKVTGKHDGGFRQFDGKVTVPGGKIDAATIVIDIDLASVFTDTEKLTGHLKSPDFFDVEKFPKARFESTQIAVGAGGQATITGNLDLHGVKKSIQFPATFTLAPDRATARAEFSIKRRDFGIVYPGMPDDLIRDEVVLRLDINAPKA